MTKIPWTDEVWNPVTGCTKIAAGCQNCYAESMAKRFWGKRKFTDVRCHKDRLEQPLHWKKPRKIFVCSMSDLFHEKVPFEFIDMICESMINTEYKHTYQILTKRPERALAYARRWIKLTGEWPWGSNVWLGVSVSTQADADKNIPILLQISAAVRFVSIEPMLEELTLVPTLFADREPDEDSPVACVPCRCGKHWENQFGNNLICGLDWVIVGSESGPKQRPCKLEWIRDLVSQCKEAQVPVFVKQIPINGKCSKNPAEWPADLRIQEYPSKIF
jgi:protein gp37